tara:strand:- start:583 stop:1068 length:486 start_codon:yes stop_codon:yes gene_type:complete
MKKIVNSTCIIVLLIFISSCAGYEPIFNTKDLKFKIMEYSLEGDKILANKIYSKLYNISNASPDDTNKSRFKFLINVIKNKKTTSKDSTGKALKYKIELITKIEITDISNNKVILNESFISSSSYGAQDQYSDNIKQENIIIKNLIDKTFEDLVLKILNII